MERKVKPLSIMRYPAREIKPVINQKTDVSAKKKRKSISLYRVSPGYIPIYTVRSKSHNRLFFFQTKEFTDYSSSIMYIIRVFRARLFAAAN